MLTPILTDDFQVIIEEFGEPETIRPLSEEDVKRFEGRMPRALVDFYKAYGICQFWDGLLRLCDPDAMHGVLKLAFGRDHDLDPARCCVVAYSAFGELVIWSEKFQRVFLSLTDLVLRSRVLEDSSRRVPDEDRAAAFLFASGRKDYDFADSEGKLLYERCRSRHGALEHDECFGFFPALLVGGTADIGSVRRVKALEHFAILAQLDRPTFVRVLENGQTEAIRKVG